MDTLVTARRRSADLREDAALRSWLLRIATRHALSRRRRERVVDRLTESAAQNGASGWEPSIDRLIVAEAMSGLPSQVRAAVALHHLAGFTVAQVALAVGKSENTIKSQLRVGLARLRMALDGPVAAARPGTKGTDARRA